jgi:N6-L-threonylcarbamoyladenine synthase
VNHLEGHALSPRLIDPALGFPYLLLLASGGHCQLLEVRGVGDYRRLPHHDDGGEAFDKAAKLLGLPYPGGPAIEALAREATPGVPCRGPCWQQRAAFLLRRAQGAVQGRRGGQAPPADIAASFQQRWSTVYRSHRGERSVKRCPPLVVAGGGRNSAVRAALQCLAADEGAPSRSRPAGCAPTMPP